jgi:uncharacterized protein
VWVVALYWYQRLFIFCIIRSTRHRAPLYKDSRASGHPIEWKVIFLLAAGFIIGGFFGSKLALKIDQSLLKKIFAVILFYTAFKMLDWDKALMNLFK